MSNTSDSNDTLQYMQNNIRKELFESELFDSEVFSKQDQAMSLYLFVKNGCNTKALELQVKQFDQARFRNRETKFDDEISSLFESLCVTKELFGTPPCLKRYEQTSFLHDSFTATQRKQLLQDLLQCGRLDSSESSQNPQESVLMFTPGEELSLERHQKIEDYGAYLRQAGSFKTIPYLYPPKVMIDETTGQVLEDLQNSRRITPHDEQQLPKLIKKLKLQKQLKMMVQRYKETGSSDIPPSSLLLGNAIASSYCRSALLRCLNDEKFITSSLTTSEESPTSLSSALTCLSEQPCARKVYLYLGIIATAEPEQQQEMMKKFE